MNKQKKGFTLIELIVVIAIIGVLAAILVPAMLGFVDKARKRSTVSTAKAIYNAVISTLLDDDARDSFYENKDSANFSTFLATKEGVNVPGQQNGNKRKTDPDKDHYWFVSTVRADGAPRPSAGAGAESDAWQSGSGRYDVFRDKLNKAMELPTYAQGENKRNYPLKMAYIKRDDGNSDYLCRWLVVYRLNNKGEIEIWAGDSITFACGPVYRVYPDPAPNYG